MDAITEKTELPLEERRLALEEAKLRLERDRFEREHARPSRWERLNTPAALAILTALAGIATAFYNGQETRQLERLRQESALIMKMAEVQDIDLRAKNMVFFTDAGYLHLPDRYIASLRQQAGLKAGTPAPAPSLPVPPPGAGTVEQAQMVSHAVPNLRSLVHGGSQRGRAALEVALKEMEAGAYEEGGSNRGPRIRKYLQALGLAEGLPWNVAFISWCFDQAPGGAPFRLTGSATELYAQFQQHGWLYAADPSAGRFPESGDLFFQRPRLSQASLRPGPHHVGIILTADKDSFTSIEGNTNLTQGTEGVLLAPKKHSYAEAYAFCRGVCLRSCAGSLKCDTQPIRGKSNTLAASRKVAGRFQPSAG